jgi:hypothetical protein
VPELSPFGAFMIILPHYISIFRTTNMRPLPSASNSVVEARLSGSDRDSHTLIETAEQENAAAPLAGSHQLVKTRIRPVPISYVGSYACCQRVRERNHRSTLIRRSHLNLRSRRRLLISDRAGGLSRPSPPQRGVKFSPRNFGVALSDDFAHAERESGCATANATLQPIMPHRLQHR